MKQAKYIRAGLIVVLFMHLFLTGCSQGDSFKWPNDIKTAVCLTYDDGLDCHLDIVQPDLDLFGFKGTFYCTGSSESLSTRMEDWRNMINNGHELGNHSLFHPCIKALEGREVFDWVKPEYDLAKYSIEQIVAELTMANVLLHSIDDKRLRTYAFTCSDFQVGGLSFVDSIRPIFDAARSDGVLPQSMKDVDLHFMPSWPVEDASGKEMIEYVKKAEKNGTIATIMFHSVGGGYLNVSREAHMELLEYLDANRDIYWVDTFINITDYIKMERQRLNWQ